MNKLRMIRSIVKTEISDDHDDYKKVMTDKATQEMTKQKLEEEKTRPNLCYKRLIAYYWLGREHYNTLDLYSFVRYEFRAQFHNFAI